MRNEPCAKRSWCNPAGEILPGQRQPPGRNATMRIVRQRIMRSHRNSGWSAATRVKAVSPDICLSAVGQGLVRPEASIVAGVKRRVCNGKPGSQAAAGHPTDCIGTWESRITCIPQRAEEARRGRRDTAVGPAHSRGVVGVTPGGVPNHRDSLEGAGSQLTRAEEVRSIP